MWKLIDAGIPDGQKAATLEWMDQVLGLGLGPIMGKRIVVPDEIKVLVKERDAARATKDWAASDRLRDDLADKGWVVEDTKQGTNVYPVRM